MKRVDFKHPEFFAGITALTPAARGVIPRRLSDGAIAFCTALEDVKGARARGGAGIRLQAYSNTEMVTVRLRLHAKSAETCVMTLMDAAGRCERRRFAGDAELRWDLPEGNDRFTVFFPWQGEVEVTDLRISEGAYFGPVPETDVKRWLFVGDSITQGMEAEYPERSFAALLARKLGVDFRNCGVGGLKLEPKFVREALSGRFDAVVLAFGVNDASLKTPLPQFEKNARSVMKILPAQKNAIFVLTPLYWPDEDEPGILEKYREVLRQTAAAFPGVGILEGDSLLPRDRKYFADGVHPNADGMAIVAENLWKTLTAANRMRA